MSAAKVMREAFDDYEWWTRSAERTFKDAAATLLAKGFTVDEAADLLAELHSATAGEFGA